jgi:hypothetical protein
MNNYFLQEAGKVLSIKNQIDATDRAIDQMVYQLYGLTEEEIAIVEGAPADADTPAVALQK